MALLNRRKRCAAPAGVEGGKTSPLNTPGRLTRLLHGFPQENRQVEKTLEEAVHERTEAKFQQATTEIANACREEDNAVQGVAHLRAQFDHEQANLGPSDDEKKSVTP